MEFLEPEGKVCMLEEGRENDDVSSEISLWEERGELSAGRSDFLSHAAQLLSIYPVQDSSNVPQADKKVPFPRLRPRIESQ